MKVISYILQHILEKKTAKKTNMPKNGWIICFFRICNGFFPPGQSPNPTSFYHFLIHMQIWRQLKIQLPRCAQDFLYVHLQKSEGPMAWRFPAGPAMYFAPAGFWQHLATGDGESGFGWTCKVEHIVFYSTVKSKVFDHWRCIAQIFEKAINRCVCIFPLLL